MAGRKPTNAHPPRERARPQDAPPQKAVRTLHREARAADALRENLLRRKAQTRARKTPDDADTPGTDGTAP